MTNWTRATENDFAGKVALVTGAGTGIGRACSQLLAEVGTRVIVADISASSADATAGLVPDRMSPVELDVTSLRATEHVIAEIVQEYGQLDYLVCAAGISHSGYWHSRGDHDRANRRRELLIDADLAFWQTVMDVNLNGVMHANRAAFSAMRASGAGGSIVNITSVDDRRAVAGNAPYCVSKAAAWMLTKCLSLEGASHGIRVNAVAPGLTRTDMTQDLVGDETRMRAALSEVPLGRMADPTEIARAVLFLCSADSAYMTGTALSPDGGLGAAFR